MTMRSAIVAEAVSWIGTPYHHHGRIKGVGVDCAMLLAEVFERVMDLPRVEPGPYPVDWHLHHSDELFIGWLERVGAKAVTVPEPGDVCLFRFGRTFSHGGIVASDDGAVIHSYLRLGVVKTRLREAPLDGRPVQFWSLL